MSFGDIGVLPTLESSINNAVNNYGVVVVASAGNYYTQNDPTSVRYPAAYANAIAVGATTESDVRKSLNDGTDEPDWGSCYGSQLWIMAPGIHIPTTDITGSAGNYSTNYYPYFNGTSAAAPHVAATVALMRSMNPSLTVSQIKNALRYSADKVAAMGSNDWTSDYGYGRLNAYKAVNTHFGTLTANQTWTDYNLVVETVTVPSGITLTISSGATVAFVNGTSLTINGTLNVASTTFTRSGASGTWTGIIFNSGSSGSLSSCNISLASQGGKTKTDLIL